MTKVRRPPRPRQLFVVAEHVRSPVASVRFGERLLNPLFVRFLADRVWAAAALIAVGALLVLPAVAAGHSGTPIAPPPSEETTGWDVAWTFSGYGLKHILLGYDHLLFLGGLALITRKPRDIVAVAGLFALSYSATLIGGTLVGLAVPGDLIDALIAMSVAFVGAQIAFGRPGGRLTDDPRPAAFGFGLAHGLGLSSLLQELRLPDDDLLPSVLGFNAGVEVGQVAVLVALVGALMALRAFPFPSRQRIPAGSALISAATVLFAFVVLGVSL